jgi:hypothetical protein
MLYAFVMIEFAIATASVPHQLLFGSYLIADGDIFDNIDQGISASLQRPIKVSEMDPLIRPEYPWEGTMHFYGSVITFSPNDHRIYYACNMESGTQHDAATSCCVAVSTDGTTFTKPLLPFIPYHNWTETNMVFTSKGGWVDSVLALPAGMPPPDGLPTGTRLIMAFDDGTTAKKLRALQLAASSDGYNFTVLTPCQTCQLPSSFADTSVSLTFDPLTRDFVAFGRWDGAPDQHPTERCGTFPPPSDWNMHSVRAVRRAVSPKTSNGPTLLNFTVSKHSPLSFDKLDEQCLDVYNSAATIISSALAGSTWGQQPNERAYLAFPAVYMHYGEEENNGILDVRFAFSRNGSDFRYIGGDRRAFVPRGIGGPLMSGSGLQPSLFDQLDDGVVARWDSAITYMFKGIVEHNDGTQSLYYFGQQGAHSRQGATGRGRFGIGRLRIMRDRWIALGADIPFATEATNGSAAFLTMTSKPLLLPQCENSSGTLWMTMNAEVSAGGNLSIALLDASTGAAVAGFGYDDCLPFAGNRLAAILRYRRSHLLPTNSTSNLQPLAMKELQLGFRLRPPARVFAWRFHCG